MSALNGSPRGGRATLEETLCSRDITTGDDDTSTTRSQRLDCRQTDATAASGDEEGLASEGCAAGRASPSATQDETQEQECTGSREDGIQGVSEEGHELLSRRGMRLPTARDVLGFVGPSSLVAGASSRLPRREYPLPEPEYAPGALEDSSFVAQLSDL